MPALCWLQLGALIWVKLEAGGQRSQTRRLPALPFIISAGLGPWHPSGVRPARAGNTSQSCFFLLRYDIKFIFVCQETDHNGYLRIHCYFAVLLRGQ